MDHDREGLKGSKILPVRAVRPRWPVCALAVLAIAGGTTAGCSDRQRPAGVVFTSGQIDSTTACQPAGGTAPVAVPVFVRNIAVGETGWFSSPAIVDLAHDGKKELVAPFYSTFVFAADGKQLARRTDTKGRVYAPSVVADLDNDGIVEIVVGGGAGTVAAYEYVSGGLRLKTGWPARACSADPCDDVEVRGMAAADLDGDGEIEVVVTNTETRSGRAQVFVLSPDGKAYQPAATPWPAWPRYNAASGPGGDADFNGQGSRGYGCYGLNVGIGNIDDDADLEIVVTYDNHQINVFKKDGTSVLASDWYTNRASEYQGRRLGWGQFIRWYDPAVEDDHYHFHTGDWPDVNSTMWLQWTASPPNVVDVNGDGRNEVVGIPSAEQHEPYETQGYAFMVLEGAHGDGSRSARRLAGWEKLPLSFKPDPRGDGDWYPPSGVPAPVTVSILGDSRPEIVATINDGFVYAYGPDAQLLWRFDHARGAGRTFASEPVVVDLNRDGRPEIAFGTYGLEKDAGHLVILANTGELLHDVVLPGQGQDGNGIGVPAAPAVGDLDGDGNLEIALMTFDHGLDVFTVPGSSDNCMPWPTGRGNLLRNGAGPNTR
jgi:hypothetical protein